MAPNLKTIFKLFKSELKNILTDKGAALIMVGGIFLYGFFYMIPYHNHIARNIPIVLIDNDNSKMSQELSRRLEANQYIYIKTRLYDLESAKHEYYKDNIKGFIVIPKDFEKDTKREKSAFLAVYLDSAYLTVYKQLIAGISEVSSSFGAEITLKNLIKKGMFEKSAKIKIMPYEPVAIPLYNPSGSYQNYIFPLVLIMILQQTMLIGITMINATALESGRKTLEYNIHEIIIAKSLACCALYFIYAMIYFLIFPFLAIYNMSYKILPMALILIPFLLSVSLLAQALLWVFRSRECSFLILIPSSVPFIFLPGFVWPKEAIPPLLNLFSNLIPTTAGIEGLVKINQMGAGFQEVSHDFFILVLLCALYYFLACKALEHVQKSGS